MKRSLTSGGGGLYYEEITRGLFILWATLSVVT